MYALGRVGFVGGTLAPIGGHDLLQPLAKHIPVLFGPHTHNCREVASAVLEAGAGRQVADGAELAREWIYFLTHEAEARQIGETGFSLLSNNQGASRRYAEMIAALIAR